MSKVSAQSGDILTAQSDDKAGTVYSFITGQDLNKLELEEIRRSPSPSPALASDNGQLSVKQSMV